MKNILILGVMLAFAGCTTQLGKFSVYSPDSVNVTSGDYRVDKSHKVSGVDPASIYVVYPTNTPSYDQAVRNAMAKQKGCVGLADVTLTRKAFWLLFGYCDFHAEGYPIVKKEVK